MDIRKVKTLGRLMFRLETRSKSGSGKKMAYLMLSYLLPGLFLPMLLVKQSTDPTGFEYVFLTYIFYSLIISFTIISELDNLIISQTEAEIFSAMPIDDRLMVRAKLYMLNRYVLMLAIPLFVPGAVNYYYIIHSVPRAIMYFLSGSMLCYFQVNILLLIYSFCLRMFNKKRLGTYTLIIQLLLVLAMILGYQLISYGITGKDHASAISYLHFLQRKGLVDLFPMAWYAFLPARNQYELSFAVPVKVVLPLFICYMSYLSFKLYLDENIAIIREKISYIGYSERSFTENNLKQGLTSRFINSLYLRNSLERSSFSFMRSMFRSEKAVKMNIIPMIIIPAGLTLFALMSNQLPPPFEQSYALIKPVFHISIMLSVLVMINTSILGMKITNQPGASWIYEAYPMSDKKQFKNGIRKFFIVYLLIPVCLIIAIIFAFSMPLWQAALQAFFIFAAANLYNSISNLTGRTLPFTKENTLLNSIQKLTGMIFPILFGIVIAFIQIYAYHSVVGSLLVLLAILTVNFWLNFFGFVHIKTEKT